MTLLPNLPQNAVLLDLLREQGVPQENGAYLYEGWELHTHPDLVERLEDLAPRWPVVASFGVPVLAAKGIAAVAAWGTGMLLARLPEAPLEPLEPADPCPPLTDPGQGWYTVCPWQSDFPRRSPSVCCRCWSGIRSRMRRACRRMTAWTGRGTRCGYRPRTAAKPRADDPARPGADVGDVARVRSESCSAGIPRWILDPDHRSAQ
jgi:hypothetical protein